MEDRSGSKSQRLGPQELAESIWNSISNSDKGLPLLEWLSTSCHDTVRVEIPEGQPQALGASDMFNPNAVIFRADKTPTQINYASPEQAELVVELARHGMSGHVKVPKDPSECKEYMEQLRVRVSQAEEHFAELAGSRTGTQSLQEKVAALLLQWHIQGKNAQQS